jgi:hypothetical protein
MARIRIPTSLTTHVSIGWQPVLRWGVRLATGAALILGFISLDPLIAGPIGLAVVVLEFFLERIRFRTHVLHVMPLPTEYLMENKLGSVWGLEDYKGGTSIMFGQVFRTQRAAKQAYQLFRAWNFGDYIDRNGNITLSIVREELDRFTILLYPGERGATAHAQFIITQQHGERTDANVSKLFFWFVTHADYWKRSNLKKIMDCLPMCPRVLLNCFYLEDAEPQSVAKRYLELSKVVVADRSAVRPGTLESYVPWEEPWSGMDRNTREKYEPIFRDVNQRGDLANAV